MIRVSDGGTLVMNEGSSIIGHVNRGDGGGVYVSKGGTFLMKGGTITRNACFPRQPDVSPQAQNCNGGGVYVASGTFIKTGGTITGYASDEKDGNVAFNLTYKTNDFASGSYAPGNANIGHAAYIGKKAIDVTIGPEMNITFKDGVFRESVASKVETAPSEEAPSSDANEKVAEENAPIENQP
ncbi:MAG: hypothetical protein FWC15_04680 [Fibromonadales bacterium]|nr:hypothetical protein [Fibromonadales bacterium]